MALKDREKKMVGALLVTGGLAVLIGLGLPQFDAISANLSQKSALTSEIENFETQKQLLDTELNQLQQRKPLPENIQIRQFTPETREQVIKAMVDHMVGLASNAGNKLISLQPYEADPLLAPAPAPTEGEEAKKPEGDESAAEAPVERPALETFGYEMAIRGSYGQIQDFLKGMFGNRELVEITSIELQNENGATRNTTAGATATTVPIDYSRPIKLIAKMRLVLKPADSSQ